VVLLIGANERAVKNWFDAKNAPSAEFLVALCRHSGEVFEMCLLMAGRVEHVKAKKIAGAGLDVFEQEPAVNPKLLRLSRAGRVVLLPHMGSATIEGRVDMGEKVIVNIKTFMDGHRPPDRVLPSML